MARRVEVEGLLGVHKESFFVLKQPSFLGLKGAFEAEGL